MTNPMLAELDAVVTELLRIKHAQRDGNYFGTQAELIKASNRANQFLLTHHATLADMAKRLEAAERDAAIGKAYKRWYAAAMGYRNIVADAAHRAIMRAAIDATQEGEG